MSSFADRDRACGALTKSVRCKVFWQLRLRASLQAGHGRQPTDASESVLALLQAYKHSLLYLCRYAGSGKALGDLWELQISQGGQLYKWKELNPSGTGPAPRFDHVAALFPTSPNSQQPERLMLMGGRDSMQRFKDVHVLDLRAMHWDLQHSIPPLSHEVCEQRGCANYTCPICDAGFMDSLTCLHVACPAWFKCRCYKPARILTGQPLLRPPCTSLLQGCNNLCTSVEAVPFHKIFYFGGKAGTMDFLNEVAVMDCGSRFWASPEVLGSQPCAREDCAWVFDAKSCCLVVFGGWANRWLGDAWQVRSVPYQTCAKVTCIRASLIRVT